MIYETYFPPFVCVQGESFLNEQLYKIARMEISAKKWKKKINKSNFRRNYEPRTNVLEQGSSKARGRKERRIRSIRSFAEGARFPAEGTFRLRSRGNSNHRIPPDTSLRSAPLQIGNNGEWNINRSRIFIRIVPYETTVDFHFHGRETTTDPYIHVEHRKDERDRERERRK